MINKVEDESNDKEKAMHCQMLANKGVSNMGEYFRSRLQELNLVNIQFFGETEMQKQFCIGKFFYIFNKFTALETLNLKSIHSAPHALKCLASEMQFKAFAKSLKHLSINACILKEEHVAEGWLTQQPTTT